MKREIERYGIYFADLDPAKGREIAKSRPVVVVSHDSMNLFSDTVVVCPLTSQLHPRWRSRIQITCARRKAEIAVDQIRAISKERFTKLIDRLDEASAAQLRHMITQMYGG